MNTPPASIAALIERLRAVARDPAEATDNGHGIVDLRGEPVVYVAQDPATEELVEAAEKRLGFALPDVLKQVYLHVGNGGFGPGYGLLPLFDERGEEEKESAVGLYESFREGDAEKPEDVWPAGWLPVADWGCAIRSCVDCSRPEGPVVRYDPNIDVGFKEGSLPEADSFLAWLEAWLEGQSLFDLPYRTAGIDRDAAADEGEEGA